MKREITIRGLMPIILSLSLLLLNGVAQGDVFCVDTLEGLHTALNTSATNGKDDTIQIVQGNYIGNFVYNSSEPYSLTIEGGYSTGCSSRTTLPVNTVLDANGSGTVLSLTNSNTLSSVYMEGLTFQNGSGGFGGGIYVSADIITISNNIIVDNSANSGGAIKIEEPCRSINIENNIISNNIGSYSAGVAIVGVNADSIRFVNNSFMNNSTVGQDGGAVELAQVTGTISFVNNVFSQNTSLKHGGGIYAYVHGTINLTNNTFLGNSSGYNYGGGVYLLAFYGSDTNFLNIYNNIFWNNSAGAGNDMYLAFADTPNVNLFNNNFDQSLEGFVGTSGFIIDPSNLNKEDPLFIDSTNEDYHLKFGSPCIDKGTNTAPELLATDKDGNLRNGMVDMGAYEYQGSITPTDSDLFGGLNEFHYYKLEERVIVKVWVKNRGTKSGEFKVASYLSDNGVTLGQLIGESTLKRGLKTGQTSTVSYTYTSESSLSAKYIVAVIDSGDQISEMVETNNRVVVRIP